MKDKLFNRLTAFQTTRDTLYAPQWKPVWEGKPPVIFTERVEQMRTALADLEDFCRRRGVVITGAAEDKDREETELEDAAFHNAMSLMEYFKAAGNLTEAAKYDFTITRWRQLRDSDLIAQSKSVEIAITTLATGTDAADAAKYELTAESAAALKKEREDFERLLTAPAQGISARKALTGQLRTEFAKVSAKFESLDNLVGRFGKTPLGRDFVATYKAARIIRDIGGRSTPSAPEVGTPA